MKIAFLVTEFPKLSETFILNQITGLLVMGHEVEVFVDRDPAEAKIHPDIEKYHLMDQVCYINIPRNYLIRVLKAIYLVGSNFFKVSPVRIFKALNVFRYGLFMASLKPLYYLISFPRRDFDVIHCHFGPNGIVGAHLKDDGIGGKLVITFHGADMSKFILTYGDNVYKNLFSKGDIFMPISEYWKKRLVEMGCPEDKTVVHHMGVDLENFRFFERQPKDVTRILSVARLTSKKGHEYAIKAVGKLAKENNSVKYIVAGDGKLKGKLESLVSELRIENNVEFLGLTGQEEIRKLYQQAHIFLLPSVVAKDGDQEGIPVVLMEAMAAGLPVISTRHSGIPELVKDGVSGFLVPEKDTDVLSEKLNFLIKHSELWNEMGAEGRKFVEEKYDAKKLNRKLVNIYMDLVR